MGEAVLDFPNKTFYQDQDWKDAHLSELARDYPNHWVAIYAGRVVAAHPDGGRVSRLAAERTGKDEEEVSVFYIYGDNMIL